MNPENASCDWLVLCAAIMFGPVWAQDEQPPPFPGTAEQSRYIAGGRKSRQDLQVLPWEIGVPGKAPSSIHRVTLLNLCSTA